MASFPTRMVVEGLFGSIDVDLSLGVDRRITLLTGPNGSGKTHLLRILQAALAFDADLLAGLPFSEISIEFKSGYSSTIRAADLDDEVCFEVDGRNAAGRSLGDAVLLRPRPDPAQYLPPYISRVDDRLWEDQRDGELLSPHEIVSRFHIPKSIARALMRSTSGAADEEELPEWLRSSRHEPTPVLITTRRLDRILEPAPIGRRPPSMRRRPQENQIERYVSRIEEDIAIARNASLKVTEARDRQFAERALDRARETVQESELRRRYDELSLLYEELYRNGLISESFSVSIPERRMNPTERRILNLFLEDWVAKLEPLRPTHSRLQLLRSIVDEKMKSKHIDLLGGHVRFLRPDDSEIPVSSLSSGEQHLVALYTMLLFTARSGSVVLIDEPEISLHAAWKHAFLDDMRRVAEIQNLQVVAATHSTAIINGEWELVEELTQSA